MQHKLLLKLRRLSPKQQVAAGVGILLVMIIFIVILGSATKPQRSVNAFCKVHKEQAALLGHAGGDKYTYSSALFPGASSNNAADFVPAFRKLDKVAPDEIEPQVKAMGDIFQKMSDEPTQVLSLAVNGLSTEKAVTEWTRQNCKIDL
jgi:hypothetical protein